MQHREMPDVVIRAENLGKRYRLGQLEPYRTLRDTLATAVKAPFRIKSSSTPSQMTSSGNTHSDKFVWALKDVSFEVNEGEVVGIIGRNGAGKTTLLKILSRITEPTEGHAEIRGRVGSLLEVGTGFHPELTGGENVYLNGAVLGMRKREIENRFDEIVAFAELEKFMDTPVKRYSSGMYVRLAFAVAAHLEPEILLVDEVLAVGDIAFQKKCLGKMRDVATRGRTVLFVSHNMGAIRGLCSRAVWIDSGKLVLDEDADKVVSSYLATSLGGDWEINGDSGSGDQFHIRRVLIKNDRGEPTHDFAPDDDLTVEIHFRSPHRLEEPKFWIGIVSQYGPLFGANMLFDGQCPEFVEGDGVLSCTFRSIPLVPQTYTVRLGVRASDGVTVLSPTQDAGFFSISGRMKEFGFPGESADTLAWDSAPMVLPYEWQLPDGRKVKVSGFQTRRPGLEQPNVK